MKWFIFFFILICFMYLYKNKQIKTIENNLCRPSTIDNPMANILPYDKNPELKKCNDSDIVIENNLFNGFLRDQDDDINREKIYPFIHIPEKNPEKFSFFLLNGGINGQYKSCKYDDYNCVKYRDERFIF